MTRPLCRIAGSLSIASLLLYAFAGVPLHVISKLLGHSSTRVTEAYGGVAGLAGCLLRISLISESREVCNSVSKDAALALQLGKQKVGVLLR